MKSFAMSGGQRSLKPPTVNCERQPKKQEPRHSKRTLGAGQNVKFTPANTLFREYVWATKPPLEVSSV
jgi:hypothetical protein